jgi:hypothetical protein
MHKRVIESCIYEVHLYKSKLSSYFKEEYVFLKENNTIDRFAVIVERPLIDIKSLK